MQNDLGELLSLMGFVMPQVFGQDSDIDELLEAFGWDKKSGAAKAGKRANANGSGSGGGGASINQLRSMLAPFVLRRVKSDVLDQLVEKQAFLEKVPTRRDPPASNLFPSSLFLTSPAVSPPPSLPRRAPSLARPGAHDGLPTGRVR